MLHIVKLLKNVNSALRSVTDDFLFFIRRATASLARGSLSSLSIFVWLLLSICSAVPFVLAVYFFRRDIPSVRVATVVAVIGIPFISILFLEAAKKAIAKRKLGEVLTLMPDSLVDYLLYVISSDRGIIQFPTLLLRNQHIEFEGWQKLVEFLKSEPFGRIAFQALFQRSVNGRVRYCREALAAAHRSRIWQ